MKFRKYIGGMYHLYYEEINVKFLVHRDIIDEGTRDMILFYMLTGITPDGIQVNMTDNIVCFEPCSEDDNCCLNEYDEVDTDMKLVSSDNNYLWFAL